MARREKHNQGSSSSGPLLLNRSGELTYVCAISSTATLNAGFAGAPSTTFCVDSPELDRNRVQLGTGYDGELASTDQSHTASASFCMQW